MSYEPLHHKYRPQTFAGLVGQEAIATTLTNAIRTSKIAPAYLFTGPRGTGKTSSARILAKSLNCLKTDQPTEQPCGVCEVCKGIANGSTLDVIEIDAASNTGVDNIRELIERAQFAPVQCRYKVYVIDECLTGESLVQTTDGLIRIDDPNIKGKKVLSYNESSETWEFKKVVRWLDQGERQTLIIKTANREIRCTGNHLIRTEQGWIAAKDVKEGAKILSPVNVDAEPSFTNLERMDVPGDLPEDTSSKVIHSEKNHTTLPLFWNRQKPFDLSVLAGVVKSLMFPSFYKKKAKELEAFSHTGKNIHTKKHTEFGTLAQKSLFPRLKFCNQKHSGSSTERCLEIAPSLTQTHTVDSLDWLWDMAKSSGNGWNTKPIAFRHSDQNFSLPLTRDTVTEIWRSIAIQPATPNSKMSLTLLNPTAKENSSLWTGSIASPQKELLGGFVMMGHFTSVHKELQQLNFIQKDFLSKKIKLLPIGLQQWAIQQKGFTAEVTETRRTTTSAWAQTPLENGWQTSSSIQFPQWLTSLERVESVKVGRIERVYDIEVQDNHNFVANGLCLHNCHMLSQAAFNALLKTLEEPPEHVVFVLATTDPQRVLPTIISRCQRFDFRRIPLEAMVAHLRNIATKENINIAQEAVQLVAQVSQGGLRDAESLLDQLSLFSGQVTVERIWDLVGSCSEPDLIALLQAIAHNNPEAVLERARTIMDRGREPLNVLQNLAGFYRDLLIAKTAPKRNDLVAVTPPTWKALCEAALLWEVPNILTGQQHLAKSEVQIKNTTQPRLWLEVTLLGLLPAANIAPLSTLGVQPIASPSKAGIQRQAVDTSTGNNTKSQKQTPSAQTASAAENSQPIQRENPQPTLDENARTSRPIPEPVAVEPSPSISVANSTSDTPQEQWQQVLTNLQPMSTRELLRQMGHLIEFDGTVARVGMKSQMWCDKVKAYLPNIKAAFQETFKCEVEVRLELAKPNQTKTSRIKEPREQSPLPQITPTATATATATYPQAEPAVNQLTATSFAQTQVLTSPVVMTVSQTQPEANSVLELPATDLPTATTSIEGEEDEVAIAAAQSLANFFKGEVVAPKDDPGFSQPIPITTDLPLPSPSELYSADLGADEDDIEF